MPEHGRISSLWKRFVQAVRAATVPLAEHRYEDQFMSAREAALGLAESDSMAHEISRAYEAALAIKPPPTPNTTVLVDDPQLPADIVVMELEAFSNAVAIHEATVKENSAKPRALSRLRKIGSTVLGSVEEVLSLSEWGKRVLTVLKEVLELSGKE